MYLYILFPGFFFILLLFGELYLPTITQPHVHHKWDWILNLVGFFMQGVVVPIISYCISMHFLSFLWPTGKAILPLNWYGSFLLNFVGVDFLYYWQHRFFHQFSWAWKWHQCHHNAARVDIWATSRNSIMTNFFFVYLLINPVLGFLCANPQGFFAAAMLTASLDLLRHTNIDFTRIACMNKVSSLLSFIFVMPKDHHRHHYALAKSTNFGANLIIWDKLFNTFCKTELPAIYKNEKSLHPLKQLLYPLI